MATSRGDPQTSASGTRRAALEGSRASSGATGLGVGPTRVVLADDELIVAGLQAVLAPYSDQIEVMGCENVAASAARLGTHVVLVDVRAPRSASIAALAELMAANPPFRVVVFTTDDDERTLFEALRLGVSGYLLRSMSSAQLADHLLKVRAGEVAVDPSMATHLAARMAHLQNGATNWPGCHAGLSRRESDVLRLLVDGYSNRLIAEELIIGEETVKTHLRSIYRKLGVNDRAQAVAAAIRGELFA